MCHPRSDYSVHFERVPQWNRNPSISTSRVAKQTPCNMNLEGFNQADKAEGGVLGLAA